MTKTDAEGWPTEKNPMTFSQKRSADEVISTYDFDAREGRSVRAAIAERSYEPDFSPYHAAHRFCAAAVTARMEAALPPHKDGFVLFSAGLPDQFAWSISDSLTSNDAAGWFEAYSGFESYDAAIADAEDTARTQFEGARNGDIDDHYDSLEAVERDTVMRVRVFDDGRVSVYDCDPRTANEPPMISVHEEPVRRLTVEDICAFTGSERPALQGNTPSPS